eukprot:TRINITY_DN5677_c0_g1_i1.p1 TRINITY_DN5677_c0_g1~~TRINITY_DN5677_c0_g1_i1.p1  ORF type:complete len:402 (+),score=108.63 TRINITY_DN5677_c0_g1_i1:94-1299(+)
MLRRCMPRLGHSNPVKDNRGSRAGLQYSRPDMSTNQNAKRTRWTAMSEAHDPRVTHSAEPWNNPLKQSTGISGLIVDHRWRKKLMMLYTNILNELKLIPEDNIYRQGCENIYREFLRIVSNVGDNDWAVVERKIGLGQVEQLVQWAMDERELVQSYSEWKLWLIPIETVRELVEESKADTFYARVGPPEPYLSDEEISDMKKIDQQRMAEEQKHIAQDLKKLAGKTTRMMIDESEQREKKRLEYKAAVEEYIRETKLGNSFKIASDGSVSGGYRPGSNTQVPQIKEDEADDRTQINVANKYDVDPEAKRAAVEDWKETTYYSKRFGSKTGIPPGADGSLPPRVAKWEAAREGGLSVTATAVDTPHDAPGARASKKGRRIAKWIKPSAGLTATQEQPPQKPN